MHRSLSMRLVLGLLWIAGAAVARGEIIYGMTAAGSSGSSPGVALVWFDGAAPGTITTVGAFSGVVAGHSLRAIDFRPATGELFALSTNGTAAQLYKVNTATAALTTVGAGFTLTGAATNVVAMDFNPVVDRVRIVAGNGTGGGNNYRANPNDGALVATDTPLAFAAGDSQSGFLGFTIAGMGYTNSFAGASTATLYGWDFGHDSLVTIGGVNGTPSPNGGQMFTVSIPAALLAHGAGIGFDISGSTGIAYISHDPPSSGSSMALYTRNLATGAQSLVGNFPAGVFITSLSVQIVVVPGACCNTHTGSCVLLGSAVCNAAGLAYAGAGTTCSAATCHACPADFDQSGALAPADIFAFLNSWFAGCP